MLPVRKSLRRKPGPSTSKFLCRGRREIDGLQIADLSVSTLTLAERGLITYGTMPAQKGVLNKAEITAVARCSTVSATECSKTLARKDGKPERAVLVGLATREQPRELLAEYPTS